MRTRLSLLVALPLFAASIAAGTPHTWTDDFENGLDGWTLVGTRAILLVDTGDAAHGKALELRADGVVAALAKNTPQSGPYRVEADFRFPAGGSAYLGFVYDYLRTDQRSDFGGIYVKADGSYLRANPFRDGNASRLLYEEYKTRLTGVRAIELGRWHHLAAEVDRNVCHLYIEDMKTPAMTFDLYEGTHGLAGFSARVAGSPAWVDNVTIRPIERLSWQGAPIPEVVYEPERLVTRWQVAGPFSSPDEDVERGRYKEWRPFETDRRGCVVSGRVIEYAGSRPVAYFRTIVDSDEDREIVLHTSATEELALFVNGDFLGYIYRNGYMSDKDDWNAWYDFADNADHAEARSKIGLTKGRNEIILRSRAGQFASGGFFATLE